ncbi:MAG: ankyrin repeat domain-containing protein [Acidobacteria bacterium]|nr:ankyrin repeat domain-containing protein [Acidobacteriota bacterium]
MKKWFIGMLLTALWLPAIAQDKKALNDELLAATRKSNIELVKSLLAKGADVDAKSPYGATPLFFACDRANAEMVKLLLDAGANPNIQDTFYKATPLGWASGKGNAEVLRLLVEKGAKEVDVAMRFGINGNHATLVKTTLEKGKFTQEQLDKFLAAAANKKHTEIADLLKGAGAKDIEPFVVSADQLKLYEGTFKAPDLTIVFTVKDGKLIGSAQGQTLNFNPVKEHVFEGIEQESINLTFVVEAEKVTSVTFKNGNFQLVLKKEEAK